MKDDKDKKETEQLQSNQVTKKESLTFSKMAAKKKLGNIEDILNKKYSKHQKNFTPPLFIKINMF